MTVSKSIMIADCKSRKPCTHNGFTLVELLVVLGIITVLISLLLPSISRARLSAQSVACASNMREIYNYAAMYAQTNQGFLPSLRTRKETRPGWPVYTGSLDVVYENGELRGLGLLDRTERMPIRVLICPSDDYVMNTMMAPGPFNETKNDTSYIWLGGFSSADNLLVQYGSRKKIKDRPQQAPLAWERHAYLAMVGGKIFHAPLANALAMDGHVERVKVDGKLRTLVQSEAVMLGGYYGDITFGRGLERYWLNK